MKRISNSSDEELPDFKKFQLPEIIDKRVSTASDEELLTAKFHFLWGLTVCESKLNSVDRFPLENYANCFYCHTYVESVAPIVYGKKKLMIPVYTRRLVAPKIRRIILNKDMIYAQGPHKLVMLVIIIESFCCLFFFCIHLIMVLMSVMLMFNAIDLYQYMFKST